MEALRLSTNVKTVALQRYEPSAKSATLPCEEFIVSGDAMLMQKIASQMLAGLYMLKDCIDRCPEKEWDESHNDYPFSQVVFHTLLDCDYNLCDSEEEFKGQSFHRNNPGIFSDYEELLDIKETRLFERKFIKSYYEFCVSKVESSIRVRIDSDLIVPNSDIYKNMTRLERYINSIRHIQHHAAQLGLRLQFITGKEMDWISRGYEEGRTN
jgi:hypothetical protein